MEQRAHCKLNWAEPKCDTSVDFRSIREKHPRSLEPGRKWVDSECPKDVPRNGCRIVRGVREAVHGERKQGERSESTTRVNVGETGSRGGAGSARRYGIG